MAILFNSYSRDWSWLSNFHPCGITVSVAGGFGNPISFPSAEHLYQFSKWDRRGVDQRTLMDTICGLGECDAAMAKRWGRKIKMRPNWEGMKMRLMTQVLREKYAQNTDLADRLRATDDALLWHLSPWDMFWGGTENRAGLNRLGMLTMAARDRLRDQ